MRYLDLETWPRRAHFEVFRALDYPHVGKFYGLVQEYLAAPEVVLA